MQLTILDPCSKVNSATITLAAQYYAMMLKINKNVDILLDFEDDFIGEGEMGMETKKRYTITIKNGMNKRKTLITLAHEMVHVKQYSKGHLRLDKKSKRMVYCGKSYGDNKSYWDTPWEIEAYGRELGLYCRFMDVEKTLKGAGVGHGRDL